MNYKYRKLEIDITAGITDHKIDINGDFIFYIDGAQDVEVKIDDISNDPIPLESKGKIESKFRRLFLTAAANAEVLTFIISTGMNVSGQTMSMKDGEISSINGVSLTGLDLSSIISTMNDNVLIYKNIINRSNGYPLEGVENSIHSSHAVSSTIADVYTVPAGKTIYINSINLNYDPPVHGNNLFSLNHTQSDDTFIRHLFQDCYNFNSNNYFQSTHSNIFIPKISLKLEEGEKIRIKSATTYASIYIFVNILYNEITN